jgi:hypothetical protein
MNFQFATCERGRALHFIGKLFPSKKVLDEKAVSSVLDLVQADKIRVLDPDFHSGGITQSKATDAEWLEIQPTLQNMVDEIMALPRIKETS